MMPNFFKFSKKEEDWAKEPNREVNLETREYGRDIEARLTFIRHQEPGKNPDGLSADFLTPQGQEAAREQGKNIEASKVAGYASPKFRAQETDDLILQNVSEDVSVINKELIKLQGTDAEKRSDNQRSDNKFRIKVRKELDALANFSKIMPQINIWIAEQKSKGDSRGNLDLMIEYYLNNSELVKQNDILTPREAAAEIAERVATELGMTERFYAGSRVELINVTHGPKLEPFLQIVIGFRSLEEIGGAVKPGEGFNLMVRIDDQKQKIVKLLFRGKEYDVNEEDIKQLSQEYRDKLNKKI